MYFSKSKYTGFWQCPKITWLDKYKPEEKVIDEKQEKQEKLNQKLKEIEYNVKKKRI